MQTCPLCSSTKSSHHSSIHNREYWHCPNCDLIFLLPKFFLNSEEEKARYELHQNNSEDQNYRNFLKQVAEPLIRKLPSGSEGMDFGCGPVPVMSEIFYEAGINVKNYDPYFFPNQQLLDSKYDFIVCSEVAEHSYSPIKLFQQLDSLLKNNSYLGIMTSLHQSVTVFEEWHYPRDPTHVSFYSEKTMQWIAKEFSWKIEYQVGNVMLFKTKM